AVLTDQTAEEHALRPRLPDLQRRRLVGRSLAVPRGEADDLDAELLGAVLRVRRDAEAVRLLVVQDVELLDAELLRERRVSGALEVVSRHDTGVVALPGRVVLVRLACRCAGTAVGQAHVRVRRADLRQRAVWGGVGDRNDDLGTTGVERADDADHTRVLGVGVGVRRALARVPLPRL